VVWTHSALPLRYCLQSDAIPPPSAYSTEQFGSNDVDEQGNVAVVDSGKSLSDRAIRYDSIGRIVPIEQQMNLGAGEAVNIGYLAPVTTRW